MVKDGKELRQEKKQLQKQQENDRICPTGKNILMLNFSIHFQTLGCKLRPKWREHALTPILETKVFTTSGYQRKQSWKIW